jgi:thiol-disulfide isomerase/thioredoxin
MSKTAKNIIFFIAFLLLLFNFSSQALAQEKVKLYFFYGDGCPHCAKEEIFLDNLEKEYKEIEILRYEVWGSPENARLLSRISKELNISVSGVPVLIIGDEYIVGYYDDETTGKRIKGIIDNHIINGCDDVVGQIIGGGNGEPAEECIHGCSEDDEACIHDCGCQADVGKGTEIPETLKIPIIGEINIKNFSLPVLTVIIAAIDGFNPCAMWVLLFLISLLLGMQDKKKMWILGLAFIASSAAVYFLFLSAWLNLFLFLGFVLWIRLIIGAIAIGSGAYHLKEWKENKEGVCKVTKGNKRKMIFDKLKKIILEKKFIISLIGIIVLAAVVNLVELVCSAGLPAVYTQVLALADLESWQYYGYLLLYIIIFMLDDMLIFAVAMVTLQEKVLTASYSRWSNLIGGIIMLIIGLLLILKPGWLMFG